MAPITNIAAYQFARLDNLKPLRERLLALCKGWRLKGTILLSPEGVNLFVAGGAGEIESLLAELQSIRGLEGLAPKVSESADQPFTRMLIRIKKEIIAFGVEGIDPGVRTSPKLAPHTLKQWLDEGRQVTLLDTRNDYEVKLGTFKGARVLGIDHFREFPAAAQKLPETMKEEAVVMFCTGGIRCEKAGPFLEREGFRNVLQLEGGILKYFEECGGAHFDGECFVFDQRVGVDPALRETGAELCFACQAPLDAEDQKDPRYVENVSCPYCHRGDETRVAELLAQRQEAIREIVTPLPGSTPAVNRRPVGVSPRHDRWTLLDFLCAIFPQLSREHWEREFALRRIESERGETAPPDRIVRSGERYYRVFPEDVEPDVNADVRVLHEDEAIIGLHKPAPLPMHPSGRFHRNTLQHILSRVYAPFQLRPGHRLDANTSGVTVYSRTRHFARLLQPQFTRGEVEKVYVARVIGHPTADAFSCDAPVSAEPGVAGSYQVDEEDGRAALTHFKVLERLGDGTALVEARPVTGRTNQIRIHLWDAGFPICGDPAFLPGRALGVAMTLAPGDPPMCLHAWRLAFVHPLRKVRVSFEAPVPPWLNASMPAD